MHTIIILLVNMSEDDLGYDSSDSDMEVSTSINTNFMSIETTRAIKKKEDISEKDEKKMRDEYLKLIERSDSKGILVDIHTKIKKQLNLGDVADNKEFYTIKTPKKS